MSGFSRKHKPIRMIRNSYKFLSLLVIQTPDRLNVCLRWFLDEDNIKGWLSLKDSVDKEVVLMNILRECANFF